MNEGLTIADIEARRVDLGVSQIRLCALAGVNHTVYWRALNGRVVVRRRTLDRLSAVLRGEELKRRQAVDFIALYRGVLAACSLFLGRDPVAIALADPKANRRGGAEEWSQAALARHVAVYIIQTEYCVTLATIGGVVGVTKQAVSKLLRRVEDLRDDPEFDALLNRAVIAISAREGAA
jgi:transcriptional regulator with XRE-family HTH domain